MSKRLLLGIIVVLIVTNIGTLLLVKKDADDKVVIEGEKQTEVTKKSEVALIGDVEILYDDWLESLRLARGESHLKKMIDRSLVKQLAKQESIVIQPKVIDREVSFLTTMQGVLTEEEMEKQEEGWREDILYRYQLEALLTAGTDISEEEVKDFYEAYKNQYDFAETMQFSHIVVETNDIAEKVIKELDAGASFDLLAREYSIDKETKDKGGYLGFYTVNNQFIPQEYFEKAASMEGQSYTGPIQTGSNVAVLYLHHKLPEITFSYDEVKEHIINELALNELGISLSADPLWEQMNIEWIFDE